MQTRPMAHYTDVQLYVTMDAFYRSYGRRTEQRCQNLEVPSEASVAIGPIAPFTRTPSMIEITGPR